MANKSYAVLSRLRDLAVLAVLLAVAGKNYGASGIQTPQNQSPNPSATEADTGRWITYNWGGMTFKYPPGWQVEPQLYLTPPQEMAGETAYPVGLTIFPNGKKPTMERSIWIGGRQASCDSFSYCKCFTIYVAIYTCGRDADTLKIFDLLLKTIKNDDPNAVFRVVFPAAQDRLQPNQRYTIRWLTKSGVPLHSVRIIVYDTSKPPFEGALLDAKNIPNTGKYDWVVPKSISSPGPYLLDISFVLPTKVAPPALSGGRIYEGKSSPFYIY
jgi:hypothetical protein